MKVASKFTPLDTFVAVFNATKGDIRRANRLFIKRHCQADWLKRIQPHLKDGRMGMFEKPINNFTRSYTTILRNQVNNRLRAEVEGGN